MTDTTDQRWRLELLQGTPHRTRIFKTREAALDEAVRAMAFRPDRIFQCSRIAGWQNFRIFLTSDDQRGFMGQISGRYDHGTQSGVQTRIAHLNATKGAKP